jgi:hypothetical protein
MQPPQGPRRQRVPISLSTEAVQDAILVRYCLEREDPDGGFRSINDAVIFALHRTAAEMRAVHNLPDHIVSPAPTSPEKE